MADTRATNPTDMAVVGPDALGAIRDWVKAQTPTVDAELNPDSENAIQNKAVGKALEDYMKKEDAAGYMGAVLKLTFEGNFAGQSYTVDGGGEHYEGVIPPELVVRVTVKPEGLTNYTIKATASGAEEESEYFQEVQYFGVYPLTIKEGGGFEIVSWADGTDEQIAALLAAADEGRVDLERDCGWQVGDKRTVQLSPMTAEGVGESHIAQTVELVLSHKGATGGITRADGKPIHFQVDQVDSLKETGYMNKSSTNDGSWDGCARRTWCNEVYYKAIPEALRSIFKKMKVTTAETYNGVTTKESEDFFALRAEKEIFGKRTNSNAAEEAVLEQIEWYATSANRKKNVNGSAYYWWERSPYSSGATHFCYVSSSGSANNTGASTAYGLAPFGCI